MGISPLTYVHEPSCTLLGTECRRVASAKWKKCGCLSQEKYEDSKLVLHGSFIVKSLVNHW